MSLLEFRDVEVAYMRHDGDVVRAVAGVNLAIESGEVMALVGETGCGKSSLARTAVGLLRPTTGEVRFDGRAVHRVGFRTRRRHERRLQMVFQDPYSSINPRRRVGDQVADAYAASHVVPRAEWSLRVSNLLDRVGLPATAARRYPHELSGGQRQRVAIARALAAEPSMLVLDEPLSALDASVQAQVANLLVDLAADLNVGMLLISHDLGIVRQVAHRTAVMYLGVIVELAPTDELWETPRHPYTKALIDAIPRTDSAHQLPIALAGEIPDPAMPPAGCRFHPRCPYAFARCREDVPILEMLEPAREVACWLQHAERVRL
jgi:oligopeptide/dipeptide ABC transporter ATP-binding protein